MNRSEFEQILFSFYKDELRTLYDLRFNPNAEEELRKTAEYNYEVKKLEWPKTLISNYDKLDPETENKLNIFVNVMANNIEDYLRLCIAIENHERDKFSRGKVGFYESYKENLKTLDCKVDEMFDIYKRMQKESNKSSKKRSFLSKIGQFIKFKKPSQNTLSADNQSQRQ